MMATLGQGGYGTFFVYGTFCFSMFLFVWFLIPETKGLSLEKMDDLFGITELIVRPILTTLSSTWMERRLAWSARRRLATRWSCERLTRVPCGG
jgi:hypothetical protein